MKKIDRVSEVLKTDADSDLGEYGNIVTKNIMKNAAVGFVLSFIVALILLFFKDYISPIVRVEIGVFTELIIVFTIICLVIFVGLFVLLKKKPDFWLFSTEKKSLKSYFNINYVFDLLTFLISALLVVYIILMFIITPTTVIGSSMDDTFHDGDKIFVWQAFYEANRDEVVIIDASIYTFNNTENFYIKRVAGMPGDILKLTSEGILVNDVLYDFEGRFDSIDRYLSQLEEKDGGYLIPEGKYLVLGDNRNGSSDSRSFGLVSKDQIIGRAVFRIWPFDKIGFDFEKK